MDNEIFLEYHAERSSIDLGGFRGRALHGEPDWSFRNQPPNRRGVSETFIEPAGVCAVYTNSVMNTTFVWGETFRSPTPVVLPSIPGMTNPMRATSG
jgi:hypothetical protein